MKEDFLHYIWKNGFFEQNNLQTAQHEKIKIVFKGYHNQNSGPDFYDAKIVIDDILWVGNIEIHKNSSDWYAHGHEQNPAYDNIILHIVYEDDMPIYNSLNQQIPTLIISKYFNKRLLKNYNKLIKTKSILRCQNEIKKVPKEVVINFKYRVFFERLENKYNIVKGLLNRTYNNWEQVLFETLLKYFGGLVNKDSFELLAKYLPYQIFNKYKYDVFKLEALLFGISGFLEDEKLDSYYQSLQKEFNYLKEKHHLEILPNKIIKFHRLRPISFPTIRLAQFAQLYHQTEFLFNKLMEIKKPEDAYNFFDISAGKYWDTHYNFDKTTKKRVKKLGNSFIDIILINVIVPLKFAYQKQFDLYEEDEIIALIESVKPEKNRIVSIFDKIDIIALNALDTQAILQLNEQYCKLNKCMYCEIGNQILKNKIYER